MTGFAEAIVLKFDPNPANHWLLRGIGIVTVLLLTVVALFGVKYLVRLQLVLLAILLLAVLDFVIGCSIADGTCEYFVINFYNDLRLTYK